MSSSPARRHRRSKTRAALVQAQRSEARARAAEGQSRQELQDIIDRGLGHVADSLSRPAP